MYSLGEVHSWFVETFKSKDNIDFIDFIQNFDGKIRMPRKEEEFVNFTGGLLSQRRNVEPIHCGNVLVRYERPIQALSRTHLDARTKRG